MLTRKYFPALQKTEILPENPVSEIRNHTLSVIVTAMIVTTIIFFYGTSFHGQDEK